MDANNTEKIANQIPASTFSHKAEHFAGKLDALEKYVDEGASAGVKSQSSVAGASRAEVTTGTGADARAIAAGSTAAADAHRTDTHHSDNAATDHGTGQVGFDQFAPHFDTVDLSSLSHQSHAAPVLPGSASSGSPVFSLASSDSVNFDHLTAVTSGEVAGAASDQHHHGGNDAFSDHFSTHTYHDFG